MQPVSILAALIGAVLTSARPSPGPEPMLKKTIALPSVEGRIDHMAYDADSKRLFIAALENGSLEVVDLNKGERVGSVTGLKEPQGVAFVLGTSQVIVACGGDGSLRAYDGATLEMKQQATVGDDADNVRFDQGSKTLLVGYGTGAVAVFEAPTLKKVGDIALSAHPESFQLDPGSARLFINVPGGAIGGGGEVVVADRSARSVTATWKLKDAGRNFPMALDAANKRLFIGCRRAAKVLVLDTESGATVASPECVGDADDVFADTASGRVFVIGGDGALDTFETKDRTSYSRSSSVKTRAGARTGLLVPDRRAIYIACPKRSGQAAEIREYALPD